MDRYYSNYTYTVNNYDMYITEQNKVNSINNSIYNNFFNVIRQYQKIVNSLFKIVIEIAQNKLKLLNIKKLIVKKTT